MKFEPGAFYLRDSDQLVFRCEAVNHAHALLHVVDAEAVPSEGRRLIVAASAERWVAVPQADAGPHMATYARDLLAEFGPELDEQGAVFRRQYHLDPYLAA